MTDTTATAPRSASGRIMTWTWAVLTAITIGSWWLAPAHFTNTVQPSTGITALVLVLTFVKARLIIRNFMEVQHGPRWLRWATDAWLGLLAAVVFGIYLI